MRIQLYSDADSFPGVPSDLEFQPYLDTFLVDSVKNPLGAVLIFPGGGYNHRAYHEGDPIARRFNELGYHAFVLQYRVLPSTTPAAQLDAARAVKIIRANAEKWCIAPDKIAVCGFSAGGHLAACTGMMAEQFNVKANDYTDNFSGKADAMLLCYAVLSATWTYPDKGREVPAGSPYYDSDGKLIDHWKLVDENTPPAYIWHTATDKAVPVECAIEFARAMWNLQKKCELHVFPQGPHGRGLGLGHADIVSWSKEAAVFLEKQCGFPRAVYYK